MNIVSVDGEGWIGTEFGEYRIVIKGRVDFTLLRIFDKTDEIEMISKASVVVYVGVNAPREDRN